MLAARCVFLARMPIIIFCFGLSGCGMCHFDFGSHECFPHYDARFSLYCHVPLRNMPVDLLKYDSYGKTSIVSDWAGLYYFLRKYPWGQEVSSYVLVCVVFLLQGGGL